MLQEVIRRKWHLFRSAAGPPGRANGLGEGIDGLNWETRL